MSEPVVANQESGKNAWIYAILLFSLGGLGIHKFYLNKTGMGILYLFTLGISGLGVLFDYIQLIFVKIKDNEGRVLAGARSLRIVAVLWSLANVIGIILIITALISSVGASAVEQAAAIL